MGWEGGVQLGKTKNELPKYEFRPCKRNLLMIVPNLLDFSFLISSIIGHIIMVETREKMRSELYSFLPSYHWSGWTIIHDQQITAANPITIERSILIMEKGKQTTIFFPTFSLWNYVVLWMWRKKTLIPWPSTNRAAGFFVCLLEYPRSQRRKGSLLERRYLFMIHSNIHNRFHNQFDFMIF